MRKLPALTRMPWVKVVRVSPSPEGDWQLVLEGSVFLGNGVDIDNIAGCRLDTSRAEFLGNEDGGKEEDP